MCAFASSTRKLEELPSAWVCKLLARALVRYRDMYKDQFMIIHSLDPRSGLHVYAQVNVQSV